MCKNKLRIIFVLLVLLATFFRFVKLAEIPSILNRDEAALAYNAYLIKESGMDEWQVKQPLLFKSFGDFKLPAYPYLLAILFKFLPISDFAVKLPSFFAGIALVILAFYWGKNVLKLSKIASIFLTLLIAINPIFVFYSRIAFEANLALFFFVLALYLIFIEQRVLKNRYLFDLIATIALILGAFSYNTPLLLIPFLIPLIIYVRSWKKWRSYLPLLILIILVFLIFFKQLASLNSQKSAITIFNDPTSLHNYSLYRQNFSGISTKLFGNQYAYYLSIILNNFFNSFSLAFVVFKGGSHPWHSLSNWGHLFYSTYFLALLGIFLSFFYLIKKKFFDKRYVLSLYLLIISLAPAVVTVDAPHATRSLLFFFMLLSFAAIFFEQIYQKIKYKNFFLSIFLVTLSIEAFIYYYQYFFIYPKRQPDSLWPEYKNLIIQAEKNYPNREVIVIDPGGYQYILTAWYLKIPATDFFATMRYQKPDIINFYYGERLCHYQFFRNRNDLTKHENIIISQEKGLEGL